MAILLVLNVLSIFVCFYIAKFRGVKTVCWAINGAIFGPLAIPFLFFAKPTSTSKQPS